jgi:arylsulfatase A-like enzyme
VPPAKRREIVANYYAMVDLVDDAVGRILGALEAHGVADETVVVFTSDHGDWLGEHGLFQKGVPHTRGLTRVPWLVRWPGVTRPGRRVESVASHVDLVPTLLDAAGVEVPHGVQGESLRPVLRGERDRLRPVALVEHRHEPYRAGRGLAAEADDASAAALRDSLVNWGERDLHVHTVYTDDYRYSHVTGLDEPYGELVDLTGDPAARTDRWSPDPADRAAQLEQLAAALVHAQDPHEERRYPV